MLTQAGGRARAPGPEGVPGGRAAADDGDGPRHFCAAETFGSPGRSCGPHVCETAATRWLTAAVGDGAVLYVFDYHRVL